MKAPDNIKISIDDLGIQEIAEIAAALDLANQRLNSNTVTVTRDLFLAALRSDRRHYLYLRTPDDLASFFACGSARGAADTMTDDGRVLRLFAISKAECPNCKEDEA